MFQIKKGPPNASAKFWPGDFFATVAQKVEHFTCNEDVPGSNPGGGSIL